MRIVLLLAGTILVGSTSAQHKTSTTSSPKKNQSKKTPSHYGTASFYANKFNGRKTANGEIFSQQKMTGACNIISLNTWVKVTNLHNKKQVIVKINDRMHRDNKRLIDLSRTAASQLGYTGHGLAKVKVEVLGKKQQAEWADK
jgi:peptidoglycan lytic transglycosylase